MHMLTEAQERYLKTIPEDKIAVVKSWDPRTQEVAKRLGEQIKSADPEVEVLYTGASTLKIAGINDIDMCILSPPKDFEKHLPNLKKVLGEPSKVGKENVRWEHINVEGFEVDVHMTDPKNEQLQGHLRLVEILKSNPKLLAKYEKLKLEANGLPYREYQRRKYEFYNKVLGL